METTGLVKIPDKDRVAMMPSLLQTLSILLPVMSTTFASVEHMMKDVSEPSSLGTLIIDEAGQALPQSALGAIFRAKKLLVLGDPKQVEPIVTDEFQLLKAAYTDEWIQPYKHKTLSVQRMVDALNPVGTYLEDEAGTQQWVGSPLLVHRRCISPMFDISNQLSYMEIMKQMTPAPNADTEAIMALERSQWIDISGTEYGKKNHYVPEQGDAVQMILREAFRKNPYPDLFIISPFTSVVSGIRKSISEWQKQVPLTEDNKSMDRWKKDQIGTVHAFQGKEAKEVIFLLGCDASPRAYGAVQWVHSNIVNVAVTRAKYRLYVIGDQQVWKRNDNLRHVLDNIQVISFEKEQGEV